MTRASVASALAILLLSVAGCGGSEGDDTASESGESSDPYAPNLDDRALEVGEARRGEDVDTTLKAVKLPYPPEEYREPDNGNIFIGVELEQCTNEDAEGSGTATFNGEWSAITASGEEYTGDGSYWNDWPAPKYPENTDLVPGRCLKGWIAWQVPEDTEFEKVLWRPAGTSVAEWML